MDSIDLIAKLVPIAMALGSAVWTFYTYRAAARKDEIAAVHKRVDQLKTELHDHKAAGMESRADLRERLVKVEQTLGQLPRKESVHDLALAVSDMRGDVKELGASFAAVAQSSRRVEEYLMQSGGAARS